MLSDAGEAAAAVAAGEVEVGELAVEGEGGVVAGAGGGALALEGAEPVALPVMVDAGVPLALLLAPADADVLRGAVPLRPMVVLRGESRSSPGIYRGRVPKGPGLCRLLTACLRPLASSLITRGFPFAQQDLTSCRADGKLTVL